MTSILLTIGRISCKNIKSSYLQNQKRFLDFVIHMRIASILKKNDQSHSLSVFEIINYERGGYLNV